jgi:hypothetical protein
MLEEETATFLVWVNQFDPFVQMNDAAARIWHGSMYQITVPEAEEAVIQHYRANPGKQAEPGSILKRALTLRSTALAKQQARMVTAGQPVRERTHDEYVSRVKSPQFRALFEEGRRQGNADRAARTEARQRS